MRVWSRSAVLAVCRWSLDTKSSFSFISKRLFTLSDRLRKMTGVKIGTHNGTFHCDEVLACYLLRQLPEYKVTKYSSYF